MASHSIRFSALALIALLVSACAPADRPLTAATESAIADQLRSQADAWDKAIVDKDTAAIAANMSDDFLQIDGTGDIHDKAEFIALLTSPKLVIEPYSVDELEIRVHEGMAMLTGRTRMHGRWDGKPFESDYRYTDVYIREADHWRVASVQITEVARPSESGSTAATNP
jgi:ketosteroid isomerase-like protein